MPVLSSTELKYAEDKIEEFCKQGAIEQAILASPKLLDEGDFGKIEQLIKDAVSVGLNRNIGLNYFENPTDRLNRLLTSFKPISTGYPELDVALGGGINRQELNIFSANSGVGKSIVMSNIAVNCVLAGYNVVYITLELSEDVVSKRFDGMFTGISQREILQNINEVSAKVTDIGAKCGTLYVKRMPETITSANHIRAYLKEFELLNGFAPDILIIDYLDIMASNSKISAENLFVKDKYIAEEVRSIGADFNLTIISASQQNRGAVGSQAGDVSQANIAGGISKVNTADNLISIIQTDQLKAAGNYMLKMLKTRNSGGVGTVILLDWDPVSLRIKNPASTSEADKKIMEFVNRDRQLGSELTKTAEKKPAQSLGTRNNMSNYSSNNNALDQLLRIGTL